MGERKHLRGSVIVGYLWRVDSGCWILMCWLREKKFRKRLWKGEREAWGPSAEMPDAVLDGSPGNVLLPCKSYLWVHASEWPLVCTRV